MNNDIARIHADLVRLLRDEVLPRLADDGVRGQVFGAIFMLNALQLRTDWSSEPLVAEIQAQDALFAALRASHPELVPGLPTTPRLAEPPLTGPALLALRDAGNALVAGLVESPALGIEGPAMALISAYMRAELDMEMRHTPKPMFAEMSSGQSAA